MIDQRDALLFVALRDPKQLDAEEAAAKHQWSKHQADQECFPEYRSHVIALGDQKDSTQHSVPQPYLPELRLPARRLVARLAPQSGQKYPVATAASRRSCSRRCGQPARATPA